MTEVKTGELLDQNTLTLNEHIERIQTIRSRIRRGVMDMAIAVKDAYDQLDESTFTELASNLGMGRSTLYQWLDIGNSPFLEHHHPALPETFTTLHKITLMEKSLLREANEQVARERLEGFINDGVFHPKMKLEDVKRAYDQIKGSTARITYQTSRATEPAKTTIDELVSARSVYKTIVVEPSLEHLKQFSQHGIWEDDIAKELPIYKLTDQTADGSVLGVVLVPTKYLPAGLMMLSAFAFTFADAFTAKNSRIILVGWRGRATKFRLSGEEELEDEVYRVGSAPRLSIGYEPFRDEDGWSYAE